MPVRDVHFRNVSLTAREGVISEDAENVSFDNVEVLEAANKPVFSFVRSKSVSLTNIRYRQGADPLLQLRGLGNAGITVRQTDLRGVTRVQSLEAGAVATLALHHDGTDLRLTLSINNKEVFSTHDTGALLRLHLDVAAGGTCTFSYSGASDGVPLPVSAPFQAQPGDWIGARAGLYCATAESTETGYADLAHFRFGPPR